MHCVKKARADCCKDNRRVLTEENVEVLACDLALVAFLKWFGPVLCVFFTIQVIQAIITTVRSSLRLQNDFTNRVQCACRSEQTP